MKTMMRTTLFCALLATLSCRSNETAEEPDDLPMVADINLPTPLEASALADKQITEANVDLEFAKLVAELEEQ